MGISSALAGISSLLGSGAAAVGSGLGAIGGELGAGLGALGVGPATSGIIGSGLASGLGGAGLGAAESAITGGNIGQGALTGGLSFGAGDIGGAIAPELGLGAGLGSALGGALGGTAAAGLEGKNLGSGALTGGLEGLGQHALGTPSTWGGGSGGIGGAAATAPSAGGSGAANTGLGSDLTNLGGVTATPSPLAGSFTGGAGGTGGVGGSIPGISSGGFNGVTPSIPGGVANNIVPTGGLSANLSPTVGQDVSSALGLGAKSGDWLDAHGGQLLQGGLLGISGLEQQQQQKSLLAPLKNEAALLGKESQGLNASIFGGQLPPGAQSAVNLATEQAKARTKSTYAQLGLSGSTMESEALNQIDQQAAAQTFEFANNLLQSGMKDASMSADLYGGILNTQLAQDKELQNAISGFAAQIMGSQLPSQGKTVQLNLGG